MGVSKYAWLSLALTLKNPFLPGQLTSSPVAVHGVADGILIGVVTLRIQLSVAVLAMATGDWEGHNYPIAGLDLGCLGSHAVDNAAALVAQYITLFELRNDTYGDG